MKLPKTTPKRYASTNLHRVNSKYESLSEVNLTSSPTKTKEKLQWLYPFQIDKSDLEDRNNKYLSKPL